MTLTVSELYTYPIKSCAGIALESAEVKARGLELDRQWMLVDENGVFLSQRELPSMSLLQTSVQEGELRVRHERMSYHTLAVALEEEAGEPLEVVIWKDRVQALHVSPTADEWFSKVLGRSCRLVRMPAAIRRTVHPEYSENDDVIGFADACPLLLIGQASLNDLNHRVGYPLAMKRFRPNIVITGASAYAEDEWKGIRIGDSIFFFAGPCFRCRVTTIDPDTTEYGFEPLKTLSTYRKEGRHVRFGMYLVGNGKGRISLGDPLELL